MPAKQVTGDTLSVIESFVGQIDGEERLFREGDLVRPDDPAVKKWPQFFGIARLNVSAKVEHATAAPGESR